ncbi:Spherulation-specific family 4 [Aspergillus pseudoustus]|uniref:Spherulation-specific family 4 n=1 Tax=Aspergillus pseudoustus TaxID=1810923 RepID=A0ABR4IX47_9EURO
MESLQHSKEASGPGLHRKCQLRRRWWITIGIAVAIVVILVIVIPLAIILPRRGDKGGKPSSVIFPLYIYPETNSTWGPLYEAILTHPELEFLVIVNPQSGPGNGSLPDERYQQAIRQLDTYPNVQKVGYVRTGYAERNISDVLSDIETYSGWESQSASLAMSGVFFDEAPHQYEAATVDYLNRINSAVKNATGLTGDRTIIHNPGTIPDSRLEVPNTDITVVFEQSYDHYETSQKALLDDEKDVDRDSWAYIFHSVPTMSNSTIENFVDEISRKAAWLYLTTRTDSYYEYLDSSLERFCDVANPDLDFLVIVNPNSGPGDRDQPSPDHNYAREVPRLNAYSNVYTVGYIRIDYCRKPLQDSFDEVARYASWSEQYETSKLGVRGIFVDETPNHHSPERADYLDALTRYIKQSPGILGDKFVAHNPGTAPDSSLAEHAELTFVCEEPYSRYRSGEVQKWLELHPFDRARAGFMISGVPDDELHSLVQELRDRSAYFFVTEVVDDFYESFGPSSWGAFMQALQHNHQPQQDQEDEVPVAAAPTV